MPLAIHFPRKMNGAKLFKCNDFPKGINAVIFLLHKPAGQGTKANVLPVDDPRVAALQALYKDVTGRDDPPYAMGGGTYSRAVPGAISFGPGMPGTRHDYSAFLPEGHGGAHGRDEVLPISKMLTVSKIYVAALAALDEVIE